MNNKNVTVEAAKEISAQMGSSQIITTQTGVRVRLVPVSTALMEEVTSRIVEPEVPMWHNEARDRDEPNPDDPKYIKALDRVARDRGVAVMDAMCMFGVELVDGMPEDTSWLKKLKFMEKRGQVNLESFDLEDPLDLEFLYKRYIAVDNDVITKVSNLSTMTAEAVEKAESRFRGKSTRDTN